MRRLFYSFDTAFKNLWREKWINILSALSISIGLLILSTFLILTVNIESFINTWFNDFGIVIYLEKDISKDEEKTLKAFFQDDSDISSMKYISREEAFRDLQEILGENNSMLESVKENPLPSSFELKLKRDVLDPSLLKQKAALIKSVSGVDDVQFGKKWLTSLVRTTMIFRSIALILGASLLTAIIFISYSTIRILFFRRVEEIETLKLLGATRGFIRLPFLIEGIIIGALGGAACSLALSFAYHFVTSRLIELLPAIKASVFSLPVDILLSGPAAGAMLCLIGSHLAVGKIRY
jgi:cell division transport system permease protein